MILKQHKSLTVEKWKKFDFAQQILMIGNELNRAKNWISKNDKEEVKRCYERALELIYLTISLISKHSLLFEIVRLKEYICYLYNADTLSSEKNTMAYNSLIALSPESYRMLHPGRGEVENAK